MDKNHRAEAARLCAGALPLSFEGTTLIVSSRPCVTQQAWREKIISVRCGFPASRNRRPPGDQAGPFLGLPLRLRSLTVGTY